MGYLMSTLTKKKQKNTEVFRLKLKKVGFTSLLCYIICHSVCNISPPPPPSLKETVLKELCTQWLN